MPSPTEIEDHMAMADPHNTGFFLYKDLAKVSSLTNQMLCYNEILTLPQRSHYWQVLQTRGRDANSYMDCRGSLLDAFQTIATEDDPETGPKPAPPEGLINVDVLREKMSSVLSFGDLSQFLNDAGPASNSLVDYRKFVETMLAVKDETVKSISRWVV